MDKITSFSPFELELKAVMDVPLPSAEFLNKTREALLRHDARSARPRAYASWGWLIPVGVAALLLVALMAVGPDRVLAAARGWLNAFIPSAGFVEKEPSLRVIAESVRMDSAGAVIIVEKGYTNAEETAIQIIYQVDGRTCLAADETYEQNRARLDTGAYLLLPDGSQLYALTPRFSNWGSFPPVPAGIDEVTLVVPPDIHYACPMGDSSGWCQCFDADLQWQIPLKFSVPAPGSVLPVIDSATATPAPTSPPAETTPNAEPSAVVAEAVQPELSGKLVEFEDGYLLVAGLNRGPGEAGSFSFGMNEHHAQLFDAAGVEIPIEEVDRSEINSPALQDLPWNDVVLFRTHTRDVTGPLTLAFPDLVQSRYDLGEAGAFEVDLGTDIQADQHFAQTIPLDFIPGHPFTLKDVWVTGGDDSSVWVSLNFSGAGFETISVMENIPDQMPPMGGSSGACEAEFADCFYTETSLTKNAGGIYSLLVSGVEYRVAGPWSIEFDMLTTP